MDGTVMVTVDAGRVAPYAPSVVTGTKLVSVVEGPPWLGNGAVSVMIRGGSVVDGGGEG